MVEQLTSDPAHQQRSVSWTERRLRARRTGTVLQSDWFSPIRSSVTGNEIELSCQDFLFEGAEFTAFPVDSLPEFGLVGLSLNSGLILEERRSAAATTL